MNWKLLFATTTACFLALACRKTPVQQPAPMPDPIPVLNALSKIEYANGEYDSLYYNGDLQVTKIKMHTTLVSPFDQIYTFEYGQDKKVKRIVDNTGESYEYVYANGLLTAVKHYLGNQKTDFRMYDYTNGKLTGIEEYYQEGFNTPGYLLTSQSELDYYPDGNIKSEITYAFDAQTRVKFKQFTTLYEDYDAKQSPHAMLNRFTYFSQLQLAKNNARKVTMKDEVSGAQTVLDFTYTYNDFLNPVSQKVRRNGVNDVTANYYYY